MDMGRVSEKGLLPFLSKKIALLFNASLMAKPVFEFIKLNNWNVCRVCVGIQVPPDSNDWFCCVCISKKQAGLVSGDKKKKTDRRKKKTNT